MKNIAVIYWSGTGNTESMANAVLEGAQNDGIKVLLKTVNCATIEDVKNADAVALGCPSMGVEILEEAEMEPFVESIAQVISGKKLALFGSYGWGNGEWMEDWQERMEQYGANLVDDGLIINETPDKDGLEMCRELGKKISN
ncbi:flavodoxin [Clostridium sediminicola]|uniref:flavodoxin n=1 Tax=Clostridium sediminicola TaxID=3114879 RepID=UPI0031F1D446